jgi:hypothetical protein
MIDRVRDRRLRLVAAARIFAGFFLITGIAALVVGIHDVSLAGVRLGVIFPGVLLVLAGILFLGAAWRLIPMGQPQRSSRGEQPPCRQPVPVAFLVSILLGVYVFFGALAGTGTQRAIVIGVAVVFIAVGSLGFALFWGAIEVSIFRVGASVALAVVGLLIGGWEFWYQNQYIPSHLERAVSVRVGLKELRVQHGYDVLSATLGYEDIGGRSIVILGSDYTLTGSRVIACPGRRASPKDVAGYFTFPIDDPARARFMTGVWEVQPATVLAAGKFVADGSPIGANVPASRQLILYAPHNRYQLLRFRADVLAISASAPLANQPPILKRLPGSADIYELWKLQESGWFQDLVSGSRGWIVARYEITSPLGPGRVVSPDQRVTARSPSPTVSGAAPSDVTILRLFGTQSPVGTTETFADAELPLAGVARLSAVQRNTALAPRECLAGGTTK